MPDFSVNNSLKCGGKKTEQNQIMKEYYVSSILILSEKKKELYL
jgi:hypothetical protein